MAGVAGLAVMLLVGGSCISGDNISYLLSLSSLFHSLDLGYEKQLKPFRVLARRVTFVMLGANKHQM